MPGPLQSQGVSDIFIPREPGGTRPDERLTPLVATIAPSNSHSISSPTPSLPYQSSLSSQSSPPSVVLSTSFSVNFIVVK